MVIFQFMEERIMHVVHKKSSMSLATNANLNVTYLFITNIVYKIQHVTPGGDALASGRN